MFLLKQKPYVKLLTDTSKNLQKHHFLFYRFLSDV